MRFTIFANWWALTLRASLALVFGAALVAWPGVDYGSFALIFGTFAAAAGSGNIIGARRSARVGERLGPLFFEGLASTVAGAITLLWPVPGAQVLVGFVAARSIAAGAFELWAAARLRRIIRGEWLLALGGVTSVGLGLFLLATRPASARALALAAGAHSLAYGALLFALSLLLRARRPAVRYAGSPYYPSSPDGDEARRPAPYASDGGPYHPADVGLEAAPAPRAG